MEFPWGFGNAAGDSVDSPQCIQELRLPFVKQVLKGGGSSLGDGTQLYGSPLQAI